MELRYHNDFGIPESQNIKDLLDKTRGLPGSGLPDEVGLQLTELANQAYNQGVEDTITYLVSRERLL